MSYRIELAKSARAGCVDTKCKKEEVKIGKGELRLGTWFEIQEHGSWKWRHWGCTSGAQVENMRKYLLQGGPAGKYQWDMMDGLEEIPDAEQQRFKTAIIEGKIADEDFRGDPEWNRLGQKGIRPQQRNKKVVEEVENSEDGDEHDVKAEPSKPKPKARISKAKKEHTEDEADEHNETGSKPAPKQRGKKPKSENGHGEDVRAKSSSGKRGKKPKTEEDEDAEQADSKSTSKKRSLKVEQDDEAEAKVSSRKRAKKIKKEEIDDGEEEAESKPAAKKREKKVKKEKQENEDMGGIDVKNEIEDLPNGNSLAIKQSIEKKEDSETPDSTAAKSEASNLKAESSPAKPVKKEKKKSKAAKKEEEGEEDERTLADIPTRQQAKERDAKSEAVEEEKEAKMQDISEEEEKVETKPKKVRKSASKSKKESKASATTGSRRSSRNK